MDPISEQKLEYHRKRASYHQRRADAVLENYARAAQQVKAKPMPKKPPVLEDKDDLNKAASAASADEVESGAWFQLALLRFFFLY